MQRHRADTKKSYREVIKHIKVEDILNIVYKRYISINNIQTMDNIYSHYRTKAKINGKLTKPIPIHDHTYNTITTNF